MTDDVPEFTEALLVGIAQSLNDAGIGVYKPGGYDDIDLGILFYKLKPSPTRAILITPYRFEDTVNSDLAFTNFQIRVRGSSDPLDGSRVIDRARLHFNGKSYLQLGAVRASLITAGDVAYIGTPSGDQHEFTTNFRMHGDRRVQPGP